MFPPPSPHLLPPTLAPFPPPPHWLTLYLINGVLHEEVAVLCRVTEIVHKGGKVRFRGIGDDLLCSLWYLSVHHQLLVFNEYLSLELVGGRESGGCQIEKLCDQHVCRMKRRERERERERERKRGRERQTHIHFA